MAQSAGSQINRLYNFVVFNMGQSAHQDVTGSHHTFTGIGGIHIVQSVSPADAGARSVRRQGQPIRQLGQKKTISLLLLSSSSYSEAGLRPRKRRKAAHQPA